MYDALDLLIEDLKRQKRKGVRSVEIDPQSLETLRQAIGKTEASVPQAAEPEPPTPPVVESKLEPTKPLIAEEAKPEPKKDYHTLPEFTLPTGSKQKQWDWLQDRVLNCRVCNNHVKPGKKVVFGVGSLDAEIFFCGEAPGADEEIQGEPFVGKAGQLLTKIIQAMGLQREQVYIGNIMNWRPELESDYGNRPPTADEMAFCLPYLKAQLEIVKPKVIIALGATAVNGLLGHDPRRSISKMRGSWYEFAGIPLMISFHPSYVLRNGTNKVKRMVWEDMLAVMEKLNHPISEKQRSYFA